MLKSHALLALEKQHYKTELELCIVMAGSLCDNSTAAEELNQLRSDIDYWKSVVDGINKTLEATTTTDALMKIAQLRNRIKELEARTTWQPIETAPDDKLVLVLSKGYCLVTKRYSLSREWLGMRPHEYPTHWMPLREPPKETICTHLN